jgi:peptide/nickel transport system substrate-binding protein
MFRSSMCGRLLLNLPLLLVVVATAMMVGGPGAVGAPRDDQLVIAFDKEPDTLNPYATHVLAAKEIDVVEGFHATNEKMEYIPRVVQRVPTVTNAGLTITAGKMTVTWRLKPGLKWSDGQPVTSADAEFTYKAMTDPSFRVDSRAGWPIIESVKTPDPQTVVVAFKDSYAGYRDLFRYLLPKHMLEGKDLNTYSDYNRSPVTTAPFSIQQWLPGQFLVTVANPNYRGAAQGLPHIKKITWRFVPDANTRINMLRTGEAQVAWALPFEQIKPLQSAPGLKVIVHPLNAWMHFDFNLRKPMFQDVRLRQAVAYAIDKEAIVSQVLGGLGKPAGPPITPLSWAHNPNAYSQYKYDLARAKALVAEAGWRPGSDGILQKDGKPFTFDNCLNTGDATQERVQQVIQAMLRSIGMNMEIRNFSAVVYGEIRFKGECDTLFHRWIVPATPVLSIFYSADAMPPNGLNEDFYANAEITEIIKEAESTIDQPKAKALFWRAQEILARDLPTIPIYYMVAAQATTSRLQGLVGNPTNDGDGWNIEEWRLGP